MILNFDRNKKGKCPTGNFFCSGVKIISISNFHFLSFSFPPTHKHKNLEKKEEKSLFICSPLRILLQTVGFRIVFNLNVYDALWKILIVFSSFLQDKSLFIVFKVPEIFHVLQVKATEIIINNNKL